MDELAKNLATKIAYEAADQVMFAMSAEKFGFDSRVHWITAENLIKFLENEDIDWKNLCITDHSRKRIELLQEKYKEKATS